MENAKKTTQLFLIVLLLFAATFVCYSNAINADFVWDDTFIVENNPLVRAPLLSLQAFKQDIVNSSFKYTVYYRPVQILSYAMDYRLWGMRPEGFHISSILIHFLNGLLVFLLARRVTRADAIAFMAALFFLIHPAQSGAVSYISGRTDLLFFFFGFLYILFHILFLKKRKPAILIVSSVMLVMALLSKEAAVIFPFLLLFTVFIVTKNDDKKEYIYCLPGVAISGLYAIVHYLVLGKKYAAVFGEAGIGAIGRKYINVLAESVNIILMPMGLHMRRAFLFGTKDLIALAFIVFASVAIIYYLRRERRNLLFGTGFFLIALIPFAFARGASSVFGEHWIYLASAGAFIFLASVIVNVYERGANLTKRIVLMAVLILVALSAGITYSTNEFWAQDESLSNRVLSFSGNDQVASYYKAISYFEDSKDAGAADVMDMGSAEETDAVQLYLKGRMLMAAGESDAAEQAFKKAITCDLQYDDPYMGLALVFFSRGDNEKGLEYLERVLIFNPRNPEALLLLSKYYLSSGDRQKALHYADRAAKVNPYGHDVLLNLGDAYVSLDGHREGATYYLKAARTYPENPEGFYKLGWVFFLAGQRQTSKMWLDEALEVDPSYKPALQLLHEIRVSQRQ